MQRQVPELAGILQKFVLLVQELEASRLATPEGRVWKYNVALMENHIEGLILSPLSAYYKNQKKRPPQIVGAFVESTFKSLKARIEGINSCVAPESVKDWNLNTLAGLENEKQAIADSWTNPKLYPSLYKGRVRGILMYGPPGTGKTVLGKAMSNSLPGVAFYSVDASALKSKWHGETEKTIGAKFDCAADLIESGSSEYTSAIVFLDEIDSIGGKRTDDGGGSSASTTPALLVAMDGFFSSPNVAVVGATNVPWNLDGGLLRRFDERIFVDLPSLRARIGIILDAIVKNFKPPWVKLKAEHSWTDVSLTTGDLKKMTEISKFGEASQKTWSTIQDYKSAQPVRHAESEGFQKILDQSTMREIVIEVAKLVGPHKDSKVKMSHRKDDQEFYEKATSKYGFNSSDITNMVKKAANIALRKLFAPLSYRTRWTIIEGEDGVTYGIPTFMPFDVEDELPGFTTLEVIKDPSKGGLGPNRLLNFTITREDFLQAIDEVGSSVNVEDYEKILDWKNKNK